MTRRSANEYVCLQGRAYTVVEVMTFEDYPPEVRERGPECERLLLRDQQDDRLYWTYRYKDGLIGTPSPAPWSTRGNP